MNEAYVSISTSEYKELVEEKQKYRFLLQLLLSGANLDNRGKIDFPYDADAKFDTFMAVFEQDSYFVFKEIKKKEQEEDE